MARGNPRPHGRAGRLRGNRRTLAFAAAGLATGAAIKVLDVSTSNAANVFSQLTVWVLVCAAIAILSESPPGTHRSACSSSARGCSLHTISRRRRWAPPIRSRSRWGGWHSRCSARFSRTSSGPQGPLAPSRGSSGAGVVAAALAATVILFDRIRAWDVIACAATAALLYGGPRRAR